MIATHQVTHLRKPCSPSCSAHQNAIVTSQPIRHKAKPLLGEATKGTAPDQRCLKDKYGTRKRIGTPFLQLSRCKWCPRRLESFKTLRLQKDHLDYKSRFLEEQLSVPIPRILQNISFLITVTLVNIIIILRPGTGTSWTKKASQTIFQNEKERCLQYQYSLDSSDSGTSKRLIRLVFTAMPHIVCVCVCLNLLCIYVSMSFTSIYGKDIAEPHAQSHTPKKDIAEMAILFTKTLMARRLRSPKAMGSQTMDFTLLLWHNAEAKTIFPRSQIQTTPWQLQTGSSPPSQG